MAVLIVDDTESVRLLFRRFLVNDGIEDVILATSGAEALDILNKNDSDSAGSRIDLVLMDLIMPGMNGLEVLTRIKTNQDWQDIPVIMITAVEAVEKLKEALDNGALDYITKPANRVELAARCRAALRLKKAIDDRKERERELEDRNQMLERLSFLDGLTGIANRRYFNESLSQEMKRSARDNQPLGLIMVDIDFFKNYNDMYGHATGDECLIQVARALEKVLKRPADFVARYGGEEFAVLLPNTDMEGAFLVAEDMRLSVVKLAIPHADSSVCDSVSISVGAGGIVPRPNSDPAEFISRVDAALYLAKKQGRNQVRRAGS